MRIRHDARRPTVIAEAQIAEAQIAEARSQKPDRKSQIAKAQGGIILAF
jgi:hypothetical protein